MDVVEVTLVVRDKEQKATTVAVRTRGKKKLDFGVKVEAFVKRIRKEIDGWKIAP